MGILNYIEMNTVDTGKYGIAVCHVAIHVVTWIAGRRELKRSCRSTYSSESASFDTAQVRQLVHAIQKYLSFISGRYVLYLHDHERFFHACAYHPKAATVTREKPCLKLCNTATGVCLHIVSTSRTATRA